MEFVLIFLFIHSPIHLFIYLIYSIICRSVRPSLIPFFFPSFIQPTSNSPTNPLPTDQYTLAVSYVTYQITSYFEP